MLPQSCSATKHLVEERPSRGASSGASRSTRPVMAAKASYELVLSFGVGVAAAVGSSYYVCEELKAFKTSSVAQLGGGAKLKPLPHDVLYAAAPPREASAPYAYVRDAWNGRLDALRKAISDVFAP